MHGTYGKSTLKKREKAIDVAFAIVGNSIGLAHSLMSMAANIVPNCLLHCPITT